MRLCLVFVLPILLAACAAPQAYLERPADPSIKVPAVSYRSVVGEVRTYRPVGPKGWEELNRRVGPKS